MTTHAPRKRFGQNFLHDPGVIQRIVRAVNPQPTDHVIEIGPGQGAITEPLLATGCRLTAIEIDRDLAATLRHRFADSAQFELIEQDVLKTDFAPLTAAAGNGLRLVGNLPYNISSPIVFKLLATAGIRDVHIMLQREVVDRITAQPGSSDYGRLSVAVAARASAVKILDVGAGAFRPPPKVRSAVVRLIPRAPDFLITHPDRFDLVVRTAFSARRKTLGRALAALLPREAIVAAGVDPNARAERLSPAEFAQLAAQLNTP